MSERFTIMPQDSYFGVVDEHNEGRVCVINGIHTKIEARWLCDVMNELQNENEQLRKELKQTHDNKHELGRLIDITNRQTINIEKLNKIICEAEDFIESYLPEHRIEEYFNLKEAVLMSGKIHCMECLHCFVSYGYEPDSILMKRCKLKQEQFTLEDSVECPEFVRK